MAAGEDFVRAVVENKYLKATTVSNQFGLLRVLPRQYLYFLCSKFGVGIKSGTDVILVTSFWPESLSGA